MEESAAGGAASSPRRRWAMRTHLLAMSAAALAASAVVGVALTAGAYSAAKGRAVDVARDSAGQVAGALERDLNHAAVQVSSNTPVLGPVLEQAEAIAANPDLCSLSFGGVGMFSAGATHILTSDGRILCSSERDALGKTYDGRPWFPRLIGGEQVTIGESDAVSGGPVAVVAAPVRSPSGTVSGALVETLAVGSLGPALTATFGGPFERQFALVGDDGRVLTSSIDPAEQGGTFPSVRDGETAPDSRGTERIWGVGTVAATGWRVWAGTAESRVLEPARAERRRLGLVLTLALAAAVGLALLVNRQFVRPIRDLSETVARAETEAGARAPVDGPAELSDLALGLNHMLATRQRNGEVVADLAAELEATANSLVEAREQERQALAVALHDTTLQGLIAAMWDVDALLEQGRGDAPDLERLRQALEALISQTRTVTRELRPPALDETGLGNAVDELAHRTAGVAGLCVEVEDRLAGARFAVAVEMLVYRLVQEALLNVRKHARATTVRIVLERDDALLRATVADDGIGVDEVVLTERARAGHFGVVSMRDTVGLAKGRFSITRGDSAGTVVNVEVPVAAGSPSSAAG